MASDEMKNTVSIDFHIHSPASSCYHSNGKSEEEAYIDLLLKIAESDLQIAFITDHNTIKGYRKLIKIIEDNTNKYNFVLKMIGSIDYVPEEIMQELREAEKIQRASEKVILFPGIEFTTQDQIHMLILIDKDINLDIVERFLFEGGYGPEEQGKEDVKTLSRWSTLDLLDEVPRCLGNKAIIIGAHVDREKGIWKLPGNVYRASIFSSNKLSAISYNSASTVDAINNVLRNKEYDRNGIPIAFVQCSDFHNEVSSKIGTPRTYLKLEQKKFCNIIKAFQNPDELVSSPAPPQIVKVINTLTSDDNNVIFSDISPTEKIGIFESICAYSNSCSGNILIGINNKKQPIGINITEQELSDLYLELKECISPTPDLMIEDYLFGKNKVLSVRVNKGNSSLYSYEEKIFIRLDNKTVIATGKQIYTLVENKILLKYKSILKLNRKRLNRITTSISNYTDGLEVIEFLNFIDNSTESLYKIVNKEQIKSIPKKGSSCYMATGNVITLSRMHPRSKDVVTRFTPVIDSFSEDFINEFELSPYLGEKILIVPGGAVHYSNCNSIPICIEGSNKPAYVLTLKPEYEGKISAKFITAYLKSIVLLYYAYECNDTIDLSLPEVFNQIRIPINVSLEDRQEVEQVIDEILVTEEKFIQETASLCKICKSQNQPLCENPMNIHNEHVASLMELIEQKFEEILTLDAITIDRIKQKSKFFLPYCL
jgi:hypothetical protein